MWSSVLDLEKRFWLWGRKGRSNCCPGLHSCICRQKVAQCCKPSKKVFWAVWGRVCQSYCFFSSRVLLKEGIDFSYCVYWSPDKQVKLWDPLLDWAEKEVGARPVVSSSIFGTIQPYPVIFALDKTLRSMSDWELAAVDSLAGAAKSLVVALAIARNELSIERAIDIIRVEEEHQVITECPCPFMSGFLIDACIDDWVWKLWWDRKFGVLFCVSLLSSLASSSANHFVSRPRLFWLEKASRTKERSGWPIFLSDVVTRWLLKFSDRRLGSRRRRSRHWHRRSSGPNNRCLSLPKTFKPLEKSESPCESLNLTLLLSFQMALDSGGKSTWLCPGQIRATGTIFREIPGLGIKVER